MALTSDAALGAAATTAAVTLTSDATSGAAATAAVALASDSASGAALLPAVDAPNVESAAVLATASFWFNSVPGLTKT